MYAPTVTGLLTQKPVRTHRQRYIFSIRKEQLRISAFKYSIAWAG